MNSVLFSKIYQYKFFIIITCGVLLTLLMLFTLMQFLNFEKYLKSKILQDLYPLKIAFNQGEARMTLKTTNRDSLRRICGLTLKTVYNAVDSYKLNNMQFIAIISQPMPSNAFRMSPILENIALVQNLYSKNNNISYDAIMQNIDKQIINEAMLKWRKDKTQLVLNILNKKHHFISYYTNDKFFDLTEEDKNQKYIMSQNIHLYDTLHIKKVDKLPLEKGIYFLFKINYLLFTKYYVIYLQCKQDDQFIPVQDEEIFIKYEKNYKIDNIDDLELKKALHIAFKNY